MVDGKAKIVAMRSLFEKNSTAFFDNHSTLKVFSFFVWEVSILTDS